MNFPGGPVVKVIAIEEGESRYWILVDNQISLPFEPPDD